MREFDLGILGGGQLGRMSVLAAHHMGLTCLTLDPDPRSPAAQVGPSLVGSLDDVNRIAELVTRCDRLTLENEFVPVDRVTEAYRLTGHDPAAMTPRLACLGTIQDKLAQREALRTSDVPQPDFVGVTGPSLAGALEHFGPKFVVKSRFGGYDGRGTAYVDGAEDVPRVEALIRDRGWDEGGGVLAEAYVPFVRELAVMVAQSPTEVRLFPAMETVQENHACSLVVSVDEDETMRRAQKTALAAVGAVAGLGLFGVEMFDLGDGRIWVNELAPRPHNSGHYTLDWGGVSQFECHIRAAIGLALPNPKGQKVAMANLFGRTGARSWRDGIRAVYDGDRDIRCHWYGKADPRVGRKMGHLTAIGEDTRRRVEAARARFYEAWTKG